MPLISTASYVFAVLAAIVCTFHVALILGAPWGRATLGGRYPGALPPLGRVISAVSILALALFAGIVLEYAGHISVPMLRGHDWPVWTVVGYCILGVIMHIATPSKIERIVWLPFVLAMFVCSWIVAWYGPVM